MQSGGFAARLLCALNGVFLSHILPICAVFAELSVLCVLLNRMLRIFAAVVGPILVAYIWFWLPFLFAAPGGTQLYPRTW